jgi:hypothetical protein
VTAAPSPLAHPAALDSPARVAELLPAHVTEELVAWVGSHRPTFVFADVDRLIIAERHLVAHLPGLPQPWVAELRSQPSAHLLAGLTAASVLLCAAILGDHDGREQMRCNVPVDAEGRHPGNHADGRFGDGHEWPNGNPSTPPAALVAPDDPTAAFLPLHMVGAPGAGMARPGPPAAQLAAAPSLAKIRGVMAGALWLCHHDPAHPLSYTDPETCKTCQAIDRAAAAVHALIGAPA